MPSYGSVRLYNVAGSQRGNAHEDGGADQAMLGASKVKDLRLNDRIGFIIKVYGIVIAMLTVTFSIVAPFSLSPESSMEFIEANPWLPILCTCLLVAQHALHLCVIVGLCCGTTRCYNLYIWIFMTFPVNYIYLFTYAMVFGMMVGCISAQFTLSSVGLVFLSTIVIMVVLTLYAATTNTDFTGCSPYLIILFVGVISLPIISIFLPLGDWTSRIVAVIVAIILGWVIVHDTQMIFGEVRKDNPKAEFTIDMYAFAAFDIYLDFVNLFLHMLKAFGERR
eukprot:TRINITY_DN48869_c0_g1_i1.p1 TRINITY_DN48869_c0_g1~~TRINITY_DN48869_c0_g1_i1.p1  ORF type:complete len:279 (+),score=41.95 TRINITY_DN48869_c0_g1_i1:101-937(+)